jgi:hypothetical protein
MLGDNPTTNMLKLYAQVSTSTPILVENAILELGCVEFLKHCWASS